MKRKILTSFGLVTVRVRCYQHRGGHRVYPLRDVCAVASETARAGERRVPMVVERPYGWSMGLLGKEFGMRQERLPRSRGEKKHRQSEAERAKIYKEARSGEESNLQLSIYCEFLPILGWRHSKLIPKAF
jgi:hypothetical protein